MFRLLLVTFFGSYRGSVDPAALGMSPAPANAAHGDGDKHAHVSPWIMSVPVGILIAPSIFVGWLAFGGEASPWKRFWQPLFASPATTPIAISETASTLLVFAVVLLGIGLAYFRYGTKEALQNATTRLRDEGARVPAVLANAYYVDAAIDALIVKPSNALGQFFGRVIDPLVIDGGVREAAHSATWLGHLFRSFQTGLVRSYALYLVFGVACFAVYYVVIGAGR
jgi:NADH:ubiquinone oxidoreductase subunit 5 (subunit L)/multisubunit Na+/H+ antiporter MnhA subunit